MLDKIPLCKRGKRVKRVGGLRINLVKSYKTNHPELVEGLLLI